MEKYTIKEMYGTDELPKLFCEKGTILRLKKGVTLYMREGDGLKVEKEVGYVSKGTLFKVKKIVEYGFDLVSLDSKKREARFMNSDMPKYFEILTAKT